MEALKQIPPVNDVLQAPELADFRPFLNQPFATAIVRDVFDATRRELSHSGNGIARAELTTKIAAAVARRLAQAMTPSLRRVINASGVILHTNLGRAPLPEGAIDHLRTLASGYCNLEFDIDQGSRGKRDVHAEALLKQLLHCDSAIVVNNNAAAVLLVLNTLADGGEVIASRGEQIEIGESFRIPEILARSGALLREVGSTNRTRIRDYENAIGDTTRLLLRVHPSNFRMIGFTERPSLQEFVALGRRTRVPTFEDLGSGCVAGLGAAGLADEPLVGDSIRAGIDLVSFSGDKLFGGPQAGIIAGKKPLIDRIRRNPLFRALRVDKLTIAVLEFVLFAYLRGDLDAIPALAMIRASEAELRTRATQFAEQAGAVATAIALQSTPGGGSAPEADIASWGVRLSIPGRSVDQLERELRFSNPPVIARIEKNALILDLRTVFRSEEEDLLRIVRGLASGGL